MTSYVTLHNHYRGQVLLARHSIDHTLGSKDTHTGRGDTRAHAPPIHIFLAREDRGDTGARVDGSLQALSRDVRLEDLGVRTLDVGSGRTGPGSPLSESHGRSRAPAEMVRV